MKTPIYADVSVPCRNPACNSKRERVREKKGQREMEKGTLEERKIE